MEAGLTIIALFYLALTVTAIVQLFSRRRQRRS
jgi:hypothetical protein